MRILLSIIRAAMFACFDYDKNSNLNSTRFPVAHNF